jgi:hypothetical protein
VFPGGICFLWRIFLLSADKKREFTMIFFNAKVLGTQGAQGSGAEFLQIIKLLFNK